MASFDGVTFSEKIDGSWSAPADIELANTDHHIPGSNDNVNNDTGRMTRTVDIPFGNNTTTKAALVAKLGSTGTLVWHESAGESAKLVGLIGLRKHTFLDRWKGALRVKIG